MLVSISNGRQRTSITLPMEDSKLMAVMRKIDVDEVIPYCKLLSVGSGSNLLNQSIGEIFDFNLIHPLNQCVGNMVNLDEVNFFVKRLESLTDYEKNVLQVIAVQRGIDSVKDLINLTYSMPGLSLITNLSDAEEVGKRLYMDKYQGLSLSEKRNIDFIVFADKVLKEQQVTVMPHGAAYMFDEVLLNNISILLDEDLWILPSSINEVLILKKDLQKTEETLMEIIASVNSGHVKPEEVLSDSLYQFERDTQKVSRVVCGNQDQGMNLTM